MCCHHLQTQMHQKVKRAARHRMLNAFCALVHHFAFVALLLHFFHLPAILSHTLLFIHVHVREKEDLTTFIKVCCRQLRHTHTHTSSPLQNSSDALLSSFSSLSFFAPFRLFSCNFFGCFRLSKWFWGFPLNKNSRLDMLKTFKVSAGFKLHIVCHGMLFFITTWAGFLYEMSRVSHKLKSTLIQPYFNGSLWDKVKLSQIQFYDL